MNKNAPFWWCSIMLATISCCAGFAWGQDKVVGQEFADEELGIQLKLPDERWKKTDHSQGNAKVLVFSPDKNLVTRCSVLHMPMAMMPDGILTRERQLQMGLKDKYQRMSLEKVRFCDRDARRLEYKLANTKTFEWELKDGDAYLIFQLSARESSWDDPATSQMLEAIRDAFRFSGAKRELATPVAAKSAEEVRSQRRSSGSPEEQNFELRHHELHVDLYPQEHAVDVRDLVTVRALVDDLKTVVLYISEVTVQEVDVDLDFTWEVKSRAGGDFEDATVDELRLNFTEPLPRGEDIKIQVVARSDDFLHEIDQQLIAEIAVLGQVRERSSFSSHVIYYPVDARKGGSMDMTLTVPTGMTAVTGGALVASTNEEGRDVFRYQTSDCRPRLLPFGFAAGEYIQRSGTSQGGLEITFYGYEGEEKLLNQRVEAGVEAANVFEKLMGPLPWNNVRVAHVKPIRKQTGVSLPGLILISDQFFTDFEGVDVSEGNLADPDALSLLVVADELSHQWNAYAVPLPNQLAEGISTFTNVLFIEQRAGRDASDNAVRFCRDSYFIASGIGQDVAIADPAIYNTAAYRGIAFAKTAVVLGMLRELVGDDVFFASWREAFRAMDDREDGFEVVEAAFSDQSKQDLKWFFDQWLYRPGWMKLSLMHSQDGDRVTVTCEQTQAGEPFKMPVKLIAEGPNKKSQRFAVQLENAESKVDIECPFKVERILIDPQEIGLVQKVVSKDDE